MTVGKVQCGHLRDVCAECWEALYRRAAEAEAQAVYCAGWEQRMDDLQAERGVLIRELERYRDIGAALQEVAPETASPSDEIRDLKRLGAWSGLCESLAEKLGEARRSERDLAAQVATLREALETAKWLSAAEWDERTPMRVATRGIARKVAEVVDAALSATVPAAVARVQAYQGALQDIVQRLGCRSEGLARDILDIAEAALDGNYPNGVRRFQALEEVARAADAVKNACFEFYHLKKQQPAAEDDEYDLMMRPLWDALDAALATYRKLRDGERNRG